MSNLCPFDSLLLLVSLEICYSQKSTHTCQFHHLRVSVSLLSCLLFICVCVCVCLTGASSHLFKCLLWRSVVCDGNDGQVSSCSPCWPQCCSSRASITSPLPPPSSTSIHPNQNPTASFSLDRDDGLDPGNF